MRSYVIGVDYGTDSCRAVITDTKDGKELAAEVFKYPRWAQGMFCKPERSQYRQHPQDYIDGIMATIKGVLSKTNNDIHENIVAISIDTTGSTPCAVDKNATPLALLPEFAQNPNAMFILWKDHTSIKEAEEITSMAKNWGGVDYTKYIGGAYSSEWFFAKMLHAMREDEIIRNSAYSWVECCDWIPALLAGVSDADKIVRGRCAAGHKGMWNKEFGGLPHNDFFKKIDPILDGIGERLFSECFTSDYSIGNLSKEFAEKFNLSENVRIGVGAFDCHMGAVGGNIVPNTIVKVMGTSTCDIVIEDIGKMSKIMVDGICGQVDGSVIANMIGMEAGQSAFGDLYDWFKRLIEWPLKLIPTDKMSQEDILEIKEKILINLELEALNVLPEESTLLVSDWINGRRTPFANQNLKGAITGLTLSTDAPQIYRALIEATAFGSKAIIERFRESGININEAIAIGGVAKKSPLNMQICADVFNMPVKVCKSEQAVALGASIFASVVGGVYDTVQEAQKNMASPVEKIYLPQPKNVAFYEKQYKKYLELGKHLEDSLEK